MRFRPLLVERPDTGLAGRQALRSGAALSAAVPRYQRSDQEYPPPGSNRRTRFACTALQHTGEGRASEIYREGNERYIAIKYSVRGRDLGGAVEEAIKTVNEKVQMPRGYHLEWEGEYQSEQRAAARLAIIVPLTILLIFFILYTMFHSFKWPR